MWTPSTLGEGTTTGEWGTAPAGDIVDISNPFNSAFDGLVHGEETSIAQEVAKAVPAGTAAVHGSTRLGRPAPPAQSR